MRVKDLMGPFPLTLRSVPATNTVCVGLNLAIGSSEPSDGRLKGVQKMESSIPSSPGGSATLATMKTCEPSGSKASQGGANLRTETEMDLGWEGSARVVRYSA